MSTQPIQSPIQPEWKQEVNQRLAAHKNRKGAARSGSQKVEPTKPGESRAAEAAARVAARYSKAPTYSQMQAEEARAAVRAAEIATQVAMEAQAAAHSALAELHAAAEQPMRGPTRGPAVMASIDAAPRAPQTAPESSPLQSSPFDAQPLDAPALDTNAFLDSPHTGAPNPPAVVTQEVLAGRSFNIRWEADLPARALRMPAPPAVPQPEFELAAEDWWTPAQLSATLHSEPIEVDSSLAQANLIEFPRELVATRKLRPRLAEAAVLGEADPQLSIFEVDPGTVSFEPPAASPSRSDSHAYDGAVWSGMELDAHPERVPSPQSEAPSRRVPLAPLGLRAMAIAVDLALILAAFAAEAIWVSSKITHPPAPKPAEALAIFGLLLTGFAYHALFFAFSNMTPGMRYAGIALCTFDDEVPTRRQLRRRLGAMAVSLLPVGLGIVWSVFDEDHMSWHDRMSGTYLRKR